MAVSILFISLILASLFGVVSLTLFGNEVVTSDINQMIFFGIMFAGLVSAISYEIGRWYLKYVERHFKIEKGKVEHSALLTHQVLVIVTLVSAYVLQSKELLLVQTVIFGLTIFSFEFSPFVLLHRFIIQPFGLLSDDVRTDNMRAHRFAFMIGATVSSIATTAAYFNMPMLAWGLVAVIIVLAVIAVIGWCAGCYTYYLLNKLGFKGYFSTCPVDNRFMGLRPKPDNDEKVESLKIDQTMV